MRTVILASLLVASTSHADPAADAGKAFTAFVDGVAAGTAPAGVELFITPFRDEDPVPKDLTAVKKLLDKPKVKLGKVMVSKAGRSAWLVADITGRKPLRASAFVALDGTTWKVRATEWSAGVPNHPTNMCGMMDSEWHFTPSVPADTAPQVSALIDALTRMPAMNDMPATLGGDRKPFLKLLSDDARAVVIGSAANEKFTGGPAIKKLFTKWTVTWGGGSEDTSKSIAARSGGDADLIWIYTTASSHEQCTDYRALYVMAKESAGWRIVHQHYSEAITN